MTIDGVEMLYRERGPMDGPVVLLLVGLSRSSHAYRNPIPTLADRYRVIATRTWASPVLWIR
jgi:pimeloyl-ACP methyl ester carboxylesterase